MKSRMDDVLEDFNETVFKRPKTFFDDVLSFESQKTSQLSFPNVGNEETFYGLSPQVKRIFEENRKVTKLYDWQDRCLKQPSVENGRNLIISLPTGGGKTLLAEILILKQILCKVRDALLVLPFVSIVQEKVKALIPFGLELDFLVEEYAANKGRIPPIKRRKKKSVYIATIEKAHSLINSLIETRQMDDLGLVVIDELHMIGDGTSRGACLEQIISKLLFTSTTVQVVGISATLSNIDELKQFMRADLFSDNFRPVALTEYVKLNSSLYQINPKSPMSDDVVKFRRKISSLDSANDPDGLSALVEEVIPSDSCLVFCPTKKNCENVATLLSKMLKKDLLDYRKPEKKLLLKALWNECDSNLCCIQRSCIPYGIAYHHSGLTADERKLIQDAFLEGTLSVICCTSTLAAGINLPAKRVILRNPMVGSRFISKQQYKQMSGRAGRAGLDTSGDSVVIIQSNQKEQFLEMVCSSFDQCRSSFMFDSGNGLKNLLLNLVGLELVNSQSSLVGFLQHTLLWTQLSEQHDQLTVTVENALRYLKEKNLLTFESDVLDGKKDIVIKLTNLGKAVFKGCINIEYASQIYQDLKRAVQCLVLSTRLHLIFCVIPYDIVEEVSPDFQIFYNEFCDSTSDEKKLFQILGVTESYLMKRSFGGVPSKKGVVIDEKALCRLYLSLALKRLWQQETVWRVAERFSLTRGFVQSLLQSCSSFASSLTRFCENITEFWALQKLLPDFSKQLTYCVNVELIPLMEIQGVKQGRARQLFNSGYRSVVDLAIVDAEVLISQVDHLSRRQARQIVSSAKMLQREKVELLIEQAEEVIKVSSKHNVSVEDIVAAFREVD